MSSTEGSGSIVDSTSIFSEFEEISLLILLSASWSSRLIWSALDIAANEAKLTFALKQDFIDFDDTRFKVVIFNAPFAGKSRALV